MNNKYKILTTGLELLTKFPAGLGPSISIISDTVDGAMYPSVMFIPSFEGNEIAFTLTIGSEANAGGGPRDSTAAKETG